MLFNSYVFIFFFSPIFLICWAATKGMRNFRLSILLFCSYFFYAWWDYRFVTLLFYITIINYFAGYYINRSNSKVFRKTILIISIIASLLPLAFFKYLPWLGGYLNYFLEKENQTTFMSFLSTIILPVGISFFTLQTLTYTIGLYFYKCNYCSNILKFATFVCMFTQILSGPIVRYQDLDSQLEKIGQLGNFNDFQNGLELFFIGLIKKVIIADRIGLFVNPIFQPNTDLNFQLAWVAALGYSLQLYYDFSGYSDMAIGIARCLGFNLPMNFKSPYTSSNPSEFWRRWHISLSTWLRDFIYIPLGGNRRGSGMAQRNLMLTMLIGGIWHGANWTFICWGLWHGIMLCIYHKAPKYITDRLPRFFSILLLNICVSIGWVFFRANSVEQAFTFLSAMIGAQHSVPSSITWPIYLFIIIGYSISYLERYFEDHPFPQGKITSISLGVLSAWAILEIGKDSPFIYFQF